jgi:hypothetical protein
LSRGRLRRGWLRLCGGRRRGIRLRNGGSGFGRCGRRGRCRSTLGRRRDFGRWRGVWLSWRRLRLCLRRLYGGRPIRLNEPGGRFRDISWGAGRNGRGGWECGRRNFGRWRRVRLSRCGLRLGSCWRTKICVAGTRTWDLGFFYGHLHGRRLSRSRCNTVDGDQTGIDVPDLAVFGLNAGEVEAINDDREAFATRHSCDYVRSLSGLSKDLCVFGMIGAVYVPHLFSPGGGSCQKTCTQQNKESIAQHRPSSAQERHEP